MDGELACACGCGTAIWPRSYAYRIGDAFYAQKCVSLEVVPDSPADAPGIGSPD